MRRLLRLALVASLSLGFLVGCGEDGRAPTNPVAEPRFDKQQVAWAHLRTLHYGDQEFTLPRAVRGLAVSDYGFFLDLSEDGGIDGPTRWGFYDGTSWLPLGGDPVGRVVVSADGRYAAWIDRDGPERPAGQVREVVVADIRRGEAVLKDSSGMGGDKGDDLGDRYEELPPAVLGFDESSTHVYWVDASGSGTRKRASLESGEVEDAEPEADDDGFTPEAPVVDAYLGREVGPPEVSGLALSYPRVSPDQRWAVDVSASGRVPAWDLRGERRLRVDYPQRAQYFGGWLPGGRFYVVTTKRRVESYSLTGPDPTRGRVAVCTLPTGSCEQGARVPGLRDLVLPGVGSFLG